MNDTMITECCTEFDAHYQAETGRNAKQAGFDPIAIFTLIATILAQMCPKPASELRSAASSDSPSVNLAVFSATRKALIEEHPGVFAPFVKFNGRAIASAFKKTVAARDEESIQRSLENIAR